MTDLYDIKWGRLEPSPDKVVQNNLYSFSSLGLPTAEAVEVELPLPPGLVSHYDQGRTGACTGFSASWMTSINNYVTQGAVKYDALWLYRRGQDTDNDPRTKDDDDGGYVWAVMDVLRKEGHIIKGQTSPSLPEGIESYYWCKSVDDIRTAFSLRRCPVFGIPWYEEFQSPRTINGEYWIGTRAKWGAVLGGHAICTRFASDKRQGLLLRNSWGAGYPEVWVSYASVTKLLTGWGECAVGIDRAVVTPPPDPVKDTITINSLVVKGKAYSGLLTEV